MKPETQILLATYNGEQFLEQQLESILDQTYTDWEILARDDGSTDSTKKILEEFQQAHPDKITIIEDDDGGLGACGNFIRLMERSTADIICFSDQDDIWHSNKMEQSISHLKDMHKEHGPETPALVHHDVTIMDESGKKQIPSFDQHNKSGKDNDNLNHILVQNIVYGFSATANKTLVNKALPVPKKLDMHDTHLALVAATFGNIKYIPEQLADYRVHDKNVSGGKNPFYNLSATDFSMRNLFNGHSFECIRNLLDTAHEKLEEKCRHTSSFIDRYGDDIPSEKRKTLEDFSKLSEAGTLERKSLIIDNGFFPKSLRQSAAFLALG